MQTRFTFLGLVVGTIPLFIREVTKEKKAEGKKFPKRYIFLILGATAFGLTLSYMGGVGFKEISNPNLLQSVVLGLVVAASYIIPGVDSAVILNYFGMYKMWLSVADLDNLLQLDFFIKIALPTAVGLAIGVILISSIINFLLKRYYTITFSVIFGLFISIIPKLLNESCVLGFNGKTAISLLLMVIGFCFSFFLSDLENNLKKLKKKN
jgi:putative membrane protein